MKTFSLPQKFSACDMSLFGLTDNQTLPLVNGITCVLLLFENGFGLRKASGEGSIRSTPQLT